ncbi:unnamed protein product [Ilex paraguariensis]|uniref:RING-type E3 ubiquitin transferase n=1 Tax=Ilex paraguariensis TaxID=185542 RepID=A0ABC8TFS4_9AQUA
MHASSSSSSSTQLFQQFHAHFYSRRLLLNNPLNHLPPRATPPSSGNNHTISDPSTKDNSFDANVVMVLSVLLCALICSLGLNSIIRCALRCSGSLSSHPGERSTGRLANSGIKKKALKTFKVISYPGEMKLPSLDTMCVICLSEFSSGDHVRILPKCNHGFHVRCIDRWLNTHSSCPTCRHCLLETCQKIVGCSQASTSEPPPPPPPLESLIRIAPLEPEAA